MKTNRRYQIRHMPQENAFAALGHEYIKIGRIKNISKTGLAFEYLSGNGMSDNDVSVDVFLTHNSFHMHNVPCEVVYDINVHVPYVNGQSIGSIILRRCGVQFLMLDDEQKKMVQLFIDMHTFVK